MTETSAPPTVAQRQSVGLAARAQVPLDVLGHFTPAEDRPDPVALLEGQSATRVPELVPVRYGRMLVSPFTYYRGAALPMASDLAAAPRSGLNVQLCGDAHLSNFGAFASPERHLVFDINDFDETNPGPFEWDVKRLAVSMDVAGRDRGFPKKIRKGIVRSTVAGYRHAMSSLAQQGNLDVWYATLDVDQVMQSLRPVLKGKIRKASDKHVAKARTRTSLQAANKLSTIVDGQRRFVDDPPIVQRVETMLAEGQANGSIDVKDIIANLHIGGQQYNDSLQPDRRHLLSQYTYVDLALKVVGVGSVGTRAWILLMQGLTPDDLLVLQIKEAQASVLEAYTQPSASATHGERVVQGQRILQSASDIFLGWSSFGSGDNATDYYVRQLRDWKASVDVDLLDPESLSAYGALCGAVLAKGHARSGDRVAIAAYLGDDDTFDNALVEFSSAYADQNDLDFAALQTAADSGRITVLSGV